MEKINRNNYETFFLDYLEGNLSASEKEDLFSFLSVNPELKKELEEAEIVTLNNTKEHYENKEDLKKIYFDTEVSLRNFDHFSIASIEGDLNESQQKRLDIFIEENPILLKDFTLYKRVKLEADKSIVFFGKGSLKKNVSGRMVLLKRFSVAASLLLVAAISFFLVTGEKDTPEQAIAGQIETINPEQPGQPDTQHVQPQNTTLVLTEGNVTKHVIENRQTEEYSDLSLAEVYVERLHLKPISYIQNARVAVQRDELLAAHQQVGHNTYLTAEKDDLIASIRRGFDDLSTAVNTDGIDGSGRFTIWDLADAGINGFGRITGANIRVDKKRDEEGNVTALAFQSPRLNFTKKINN